MSAPSSLLLLGLLLLLSALGESSSQCHKKYQAQWEVGHSACLEPSSDFKKGGVLTGTDRQTIVDRHAVIRRTVDPVAINMQMMVWDDEIAEIARAWASQCKYEHDTAQARRVPGKYVVGQNMGFGYSNVDDLIAAWALERTHFTYEGDSNDVKLVKNYTQMVWAKTAKIGCAYAECDDMQKLYFCNYAPSMSVETLKRPYSTGERCGSCPDTCVNGLCDCGGKVCENSATIDLKRCTCSCMPQNEYPTDTCSLNCSVITDDIGVGCERDSCHVIGMAPMCAYTCKDCPYAGVDYIDPDSGGIRTHPLKVLLVLLSLLLLAIHL